MSLSLRKLHFNPDREAVCYSGERILGTHTWVQIPSLPSPAGSLALYVLNQDKSAFLR